MNKVQVLIFTVITLASGSQLRVPPPTYDDANIPAPLPGQQRDDVDVCKDPGFKCKWINSSGNIVDDIADQEKPYHLEVAATNLVSSHSQQVGTDVVRLMVRHMPKELFAALAATASVGLFTSYDKTTIFPEYSHLRDTPQCSGRCDGSCSVTCTTDGRKYDTLTGVGGIRGTCLDDNFMCTPSDPYWSTDNILVHEFAHTIHQYALPNVPGDWWNKIYYAWYNAYYTGIWNSGSYAMVNHLEYFAEGTGVFFNVNHHSTSTGGMNSCGKSFGFCDCPEDGRAWLKQRDPQLYEALIYTYANNDHLAPGELNICMTDPNNINCEM